MYMTIAIVRVSLDCGKPEGGVINNLLVDYHARETNESPRYFTLRLLYPEPNSLSEQIQTLRGVREGE